MERGCAVCQCPAPSPNKWNGGFDLGHIDANKKHSGCPSEPWSIFYHHALSVKVKSREMYPDGPKGKKNIRWECTKCNQSRGGSDQDAKRMKRNYTSQIGFWQWSARQISMVNSSSAQSIQSINIKSHPFKFSSGVLSADAQSNTTRISSEWFVLNGFILLTHTLAYEFTLKLDFRRTLVRWCELCSCLE